MAFTTRIVGRAFGTVDQPRETFTENAKGEQIIKRVYRTLFIDWLNTSPNRGSAHPTYPEAKLEQKDAAKIDPGWLCDVTLTYKKPAPESVTPESGAQLPIPRYSEVVSEGTAPIEQHPNFADFATDANGAIFDTDGKFTGWKTDSPYVGYLTYETGSVTDSTTTYFWGPPASVSTLIGAVSGNWRTCSGSIQREGIYWSRTINRKHNPNGWPSPIYGGT